MAGTPEAGFLATGGLRLEVREGMDCGPAPACLGELAWQQWWEIEFPAHLGGSCGPAFLARRAEPSRAGNGWLGTVPTSCC